MAWPSGGVPKPVGFGIIMAKLGEAIRSSPAVATAFGDPIKKCASTYAPSRPMSITHIAANDRLANGFALSQSKSYYVVAKHGAHCVELFKLLQRPHSAVIAFPLLRALTEGGGLCGCSRSQNVPQ